MLFNSLKQRAKNFVDVLKYVYDGRKAPSKDYEDALAKIVKG